MLPDKIVMFCSPSITKVKLITCFAQFLILQIYDFFSRNFLCFVSLQGRSCFFEMKNADITVYHNRKRHLKSPLKMKDKIREKKTRRFRIRERHVMNSLKDVEFIILA